MKIFLTLIFLLTLNSFADARLYDFDGIVRDSRTNEPLGFVTIKLENTNIGSTSDVNGEFKLKLENGLHRVIFSLIGYFSDTAIVNINDEKESRDIYLRATEIFTEVIEVEGEDPAYEIIRRALVYKRNFNRNLIEYELNAYSKMIIRSNQRSVTIPDSIKTSDSDLGILGILESETESYFKKPNLTKQIVTAKRETANITRGFALPYIVNFYDDNVDLQTVTIPGPLSENTFDNYDFKLTGTTSFDSKTVFKIDVYNKSEREPQFFGEIFILDSIFSLIKIDLKTNSATDIRFINNINFIQNFNVYYDEKGNEFWLPTDVKILADGSVGGMLGLLQINADVFTIVTNYKINKPAPPGIFNDVIIKVEPDAGKDNEYWQERSLVRTTEEEEYVFEKIQSEQENEKNKISIGLGSINYGKHFSSSPLAFYKYNRVEGNSVSVNARYNSQFWRESISGSIGYGFADKKTKYFLSASARLLSDRRFRINGSIFRRLTNTADSPDEMRVFLNTLEAIGYKKDVYDYFYTSGYSIGLSYSPNSMFDIGLSFNQQKQWSAQTNSDFSVLKPDESFKLNPAINEAFLRTFTTRLNINLNKSYQIDWGDGDISNLRTSFDIPRIEFRYSITPKSIGSNYEFRKFSGIIGGRNRLNYFLNFRYVLGGDYYSGEVPYQMLGHITDNNGRGLPEFGIRTIRYHEYMGDQVYYLKFDNNFGKLLWGDILFLKDFNLLGFINAMKIDISDRNRELAIYKGFKQTDGIFVEAGFGIGRILDILRLDFAWRLNNFQPGSNFGLYLSWDTF